MKKFLTENFVLAAGIALPLLLVLLFWMATYLPAMYVDPPQYDFLYTARNYSNNIPDALTVRIDTVGDQARVRTAARWSADNYDRYNNPKIYRFDAKTGQSFEISYKEELEKQVPKEFYNCVKPGINADPTASGTAVMPNRGECPNIKTAGPNDYTEIKLPELQKIRLYTDKASPDGYRFEYGGYGNRSLFGEIFYNNRHNPQFRVVKDGRSYPIRNPDVMGYYGSENINFLGWIRKD